jgi:hypothetical protein
MQDGTAESADQAPSALSGLSDRDRRRLRLLARRYRMRQATRVPPVADIAHNTTLRYHGLPSGRTGNGEPARR